MTVISAALLGVAGCGNAATGGPVGAPEVILGKAPDVTLAQGSALIAITSPAGEASGPISLATHDGRLTLAADGLNNIDLVIVGGTGYLKTPTERTYRKLAGTLPTILPSADPWAGIDLIRGVVHILSNGGGEIEGVSTISYTLTIDPQQAVETTPPARQAALQALLAGRTTLFMIEVWIDTQYRIRRIQVATDLNFNGETPPTRVDGATISSAVDFVRFGVSVPTVTVPPN